MMKEIEGKMKGVICPEDFSPRFQEKLTSSPPSFIGGRHDSLHDLFVTSVTWRWLGCAGFCHGSLATTLGAANPAGDTPALFSAKIRNSYALPGMRSVMRYSVSRTAARFSRLQLLEFGPAPLNVIACDGSAAVRYGRRPGEQARVGRDVCDARLSRCSREHLVGIKW